MSNPFVESVLKEIIHPGVEQLMSTRFFTELRAGKLSKKRIQGFAVQHYLSNHVINKGLAFSMVRNANNQAMYEQFIELFTEEQSHPGLMRRFGLAMGLTDADFDDGIMIFECVAHTGAIVRGMLVGAPAETRVGALVNETMVQRYSDEFDTHMRRHYNLGDSALQFFLVHKVADEDHIKMACEIIARNTDTPAMEERVRQTADYAVRFKLGKFDGIYRHYS